MKKVTMKELTNWVTFEEEGKKQMSIAQVKEVLAIISDLTVGPCGGEVINALTSNGIRRAKRKKK